MASTTRGKRLIVLMVGLLLMTAVPAVAQAAIPTCRGQAATIVVTPTTPQPVEGTPADDVIVGSDGDDVIHGNDGRDLICGGKGDDTITGGFGRDRLYGQSGDDTIDGGEGDDSVVGNSGADDLSGGPGNDRLYGGRDDDLLSGGDDRGAGTNQDRCDGGPAGVGGDIETDDTCESLASVIETFTVSVDTTGAVANDLSFAGSQSDDGRYVAFFSRATNLVPGDTNNDFDVFVKDRMTGQVQRVSVASDGSQASGRSLAPSISDDGRYVAFESGAPDLDPGSANAGGEVYVHDRVTGVTERVSVATDGTIGEGRSYQAAISGNGRRVAFTSDAQTLVADDTNGNSDIYVHDRDTDTTTRVSVATDGTQGNGNATEPSLSDDGRYVSYRTSADNLAAGDTNGTFDVFVHDLNTSTTTRVSVATDGSEGNGMSFHPELSGDGQFVTFASQASNLVADDTNGTADVFVRDLAAGTTTAISVAADGTYGDEYSDSPSISDGGRFIAYASQAGNLVPGSSDWVVGVFVHDRVTGTVALASRASDGTPGNNNNSRPFISGDGDHVGFDSDATTLGPTGGVTPQVYVHDRDT